MWKRKKSARRAAAPRLELCDLCAATFPAGEAVIAHVPDFSAVHPVDERSDGIRLLTACGDAHLAVLRELYRRRPFVQEELWAGKITRALTSGAPALTVEQLACRTGLHEPQLRRAVAWHNRHRRQEREEHTDP
ncbi:hypothetical protein ABZ920_02055 [Streptomyces sp. NPDC046831]|uniref:hypothetical protein n=1 Tax=Streptomyces sp. NPDC046831 TaxID=3154805 RepID=UPI0033D89F27